MPPMPTRYPEGTPLTGARLAQLHQSWAAATRAPLNDLPYHRLVLHVGELLTEVDRLHSTALAALSYLDELAATQTRYGDDQVDCVLNWHRTTLAQALAR